MLQPLNHNVPDGRDESSRLASLSLSPTGDLRDFSIIASGENITRLDGERVIISRYGAEREMAQIFTLRSDSLTDEQREYIQAIRSENIAGKDILILPAYGPNAPFFALLGAKNVVGIDADPISLAWQKAYAGYFHHRNIGPRFFKQQDLFIPDRDSPKEFEKLKPLFESEFREALVYAVKRSLPKNGLDNLNFFQATLGKPCDNDRVIADMSQFDFAYIPYLLGIHHGVMSVEGVVKAFDQLWEAALPGARVVVAPWGYNSKYPFPYGDEKIVRALSELLPAAKFEVESSVSIGHTDFGFLRVRK